MELERVSPSPARTTPPELVSFSFSFFSRGGEPEEGSAMQGGEVELKRIKINFFFSSLSLSLESNCERTQKGPVTSRVTRPVASLHNPGASPRPASHRKSKIWKRSPVRVQGESVRGIGPSQSHDLPFRWFLFLPHRASSSSLSLSLCLLSLPLAS